MEGLDLAGGVDGAKPVPLACGYRLPVGEHFPIIMETTDGTIEEASLWRNSRLVNWDVMAYNKYHALQQFVCNISTFSVGISQQRTQRRREH